MSTIFVGVRDVELMVVSKGLRNTPCEVDPLIAPLALRSRQHSLHCGYGTTPLFH